MTVLIYSTKMRGAGKKILQLIEAIVSKTNVHIYRTLDSLQNALRQPRKDVNIAILLPSSKKDLMDLLSIQELLRDMKIILVLPDDNPETVAKGHMLRPRFVSYCDNDFVDVSAVLSLMIRKLGNNKNIDSRYIPKGENSNITGNKFHNAKADDNL